MRILPEQKPKKDEHLYPDPPISHPQLSSPHHHASFAVGRSTVLVQACLVRSMATRRQLDVYFSQKDATRAARFVSYVPEPLCKAWGYFGTHIGGRIDYRNTDGLLSQRFAHADSQGTQKLLCVETHPATFGYCFTLVGHVGMPNPFPLRHSSDRNKIDP